MKQDFKKVLKDLEVKAPSGKTVNNIVAKIIKKEIERWKEIKISWVLLGVLAVLGMLGIIKILEAMEILDTAGFWVLAGQDRSFLNWQSFYEGFPVTEALFIIFITLILLVPIWVIRHKDKEIGR